VKIMVVDDYEDIREITRMMLEVNGHEVVEAADGREAVLYATGGGLDLTLMDLNLPVLDGYEATRRIVSHPHSRHVPVVAFSAQCGGERRRRALEAGCVECVVKLLDFPKLGMIVSRYGPIS
jgi:CheY-like chemotaxis protein